MNNEEIVAKRYVKALKESFDNEQFEALDAVFSALANGFKNEKFVEFMRSPEVSDASKATFLLDAVRPLESTRVDNFMNLLIEEKRIEIIPALSQEIKKELAKVLNSYKGCVYSNSIVEQETVNKLSEGMSKKIGSNIVLEFVQNDFDGIKVEIADLGLEIDFSQSKADAQIIEHILKAI
jgi:F-type H+-transporting ATPase subunit delta